MGEQGHGFGVGNFDQLRRAGIGQHVGPVVQVFEEDLDGMRQIPFTDGRQPGYDFRDALSLLTDRQVLIGRQFPDIIRSQKFDRRRTVRLLGSMAIASPGYQRSGSVYLFPRRVYR